MTERRLTDFFSGGGEMGALMRAHDWSSSPVGPPEQWPQSLRTVIRLALTSHHPMFIFWGPELIQFYNDAYRHTLDEVRHPRALGQRGRECWAEIWDIIGPQIDYVMSGKGATWHEDQLIPTTRHGRRQDIWWTYGYSPIDDENAENGIGGVLVVCNDVTEQHRVLENLAIQEERLEVALSAGLIGIWDWHVEPDILFADDRFCALFGVPEEEGRNGAPIGRFVASIHPDDRERVVEAVERALASDGAPYSEECRVIAADGSVRWIMASGRCFRDSTGKPTRFPGATFDITERKQNEDRLKLLTQELNHRIRNMMATVQGIVNQTVKDGVPLTGARRSLSGRIQALARAQNVLTGDHWDRAEITTLVRSAIEPHAEDSGRIVIEGPEQEISARAAFAFSLILHELATNAVKYGALSAPSGSVLISWRVSDADTEDAVLTFAWTERGGPSVRPPRKTGFGSQLIERLLSAELGATVDLDYRPKGLRCTVTMPVGRSPASPSLAGGENRDRLTRF